MYLDFDKPDYTGSSSKRHLDNSVPIPVNLARITQTSALLKIQAKRVGNLLAQLIKLDENIIRKAFSNCQDLCI